MITTFARGTLATASLVLLATPVLADDSGHAGSWTAQITKQEARPLGSPDHVLVAQVAQGTNRSMGSASVFEGAQVLFSETMEMKQGNGPQHGLISFIDAKGSQTNEYQGKITTTMAGDQPRTGGEGTWKFVSGTGAYQDAKGSGTYKFTITSQTEFKGEWKESMKSTSR